MEAVSAICYAWGKAHNNPPHDLWVKLILHFESSYENVEMQLTDVVMDIQCNIPG